MISSAPGWDRKYFLERLPRATAVDGIALVVAHIDRLSKEADGITWHTPHEYFPELQREHCPQGLLQLGRGNGIPGCHPFLERSMSANVVAGTRRTAEGSMTAAGKSTARSLVVRFGMDLKGNKRIPASRGVTAIWAFLPWCNRSHTKPADTSGRLSRRIS